MEYDKHERDLLKFEDNINHLKYSARDPNNFKCFTFPESLKIADILTILDDIFGTAGITKVIVISSELLRPKVIFEFYGKYAIMMSVGTVSNVHFHGNIGYGDIYSEFSWAEFKKGGIVLRAKL
jgi:hypothetical protein